MSGGGGFDTEAWLAQLGAEFAAYAGAFRANHVDAAVLPLLSSDDLREMGVASVGHRRRILAAAAAGGTVAPAAPAPVAERRDERRLLTVMFCDLVDSTALSVASEAEDYVAFIGQFREAVGAAISPFGGTVVNYQGDGVMACFGFPAASDHDAERAVAAGLAVVEVVARLEPFAGHTPRVRVGIATGITVVGSGTADGIADLSAVGETPNLAARLHAVASPGTVVIAHQTRALIGEIFTCADLGTPAIRGASGPVRVWQVTGRSSSVSRFEALREGGRSAPFVGRAAERAALARLFAAPPAQPLVVTGDPGIGKSRLLRAALAEAGLAQPLILQCSPYNAGVPLYPLRYLLVRLTGIGAGQAEPTALSALEDLLSGLGLSGPQALALLAEFLGLGDGAALRGLSPADLRGRLLGLLEAVLLGLARRAGVLVVEDADWLDPSTGDLLRTACARLGAEGLPVVWTARPGPLPGWQGELAALPLDRLGVAETEALVGGLSGPGGLPAEVLRAIVERSDGVPIFAEELARNWIESAPQPGAEVSAAGRLAQLPMTLSESLLARLDRLVDGRRIAALAAAIGREFPLAILVAVADLPAGVVLAGVGELLAAEVLVPGQSQFGEAIRFRQNLVREAAYDSILRRRRAPLHARIADVLEAQFPEIARALPHIMATQRSLAGQHDAASREWERAAREASQRSAYAEATGFCARALQENALLDPDRPRDLRELDLRVTHLGALICARGYQSAEAAEETARISALAEALGEAALLMPALQARWVQLGSANNARAALDFARKAREAARNGALTDRLIATRMCATSLLFCGRLAEALGEYRAFMAAYDPSLHAPAMRTGHSDHATMVMMGLAETYTLMGQAEEADHWRHAALDAARGSGRLHDRCHTLTFAGCFHALLLGRQAEAEGFIGELAAILAEHAMPNWAGYHLLFRGILDVHAGRVEAGLGSARRGVETLINARAFGNWWYLLHAEICLDAGVWDEAEAMLALAAPISALGEQRLAPELDRLAARLVLGRGAGPAEAAARLAAARELAAEQGAGLLLARIERDQRRLSPAAALAV